MKKLILFGDSLISLFGKEEETMLEEKSIYKVYNCATSGWDTNDGVQKAPYISMLNPDAIVLSFGTNDSAPWKSVELVVFTENVQKILETFSNSKIVFLLPPPTKDERRSNELIEQYSESIKSVCIENGAEYIDSWVIFKKMMGDGQNYHDADKLHFNDLGYKTVVDEITRILNF